MRKVGSLDLAPTFLYYWIAGVENIINKAAEGPQIVFVEGLQWLNVKSI